MSFGGDEIDRMLEASHQKTRRSSPSYREGRRGERRRRSRSRSRGRRFGGGGGRRRGSGHDERFYERGYEEVDKDQRTVFACQIHPRMDERDIFEFFSNVGKVVDIQLIRDNRTFKSKGLAYVEFADKASISAALQLSGQPLGGHPISVQLTQAEKNRAAQQAAVQAAVQPPMRLYIGNIHPKVTDKDLQPVFGAFGDILRLEIDVDRRGRSKGTGFVEFRKENEAVAAMSQLNDLEILGQRIKVSSAEVDREPGNVIHDMAMPVAPSGRLEEESGNGGLALTATGKIALMQRLARNTIKPTEIRAPFPLPGQPGYVSTSGSGQTNGGSQSGPPPTASNGSSSSSRCVLLTNMFDPSTETDPDFDFEIREDVSEEVKKYGNLSHIYVDKSNPEGLVYIKFSQPSEAAATCRALSGRWFAKNQIKATIVPEAEYKARFGEHV